MCEKPLCMLHGVNNNPKVYHVIRRIHVIEVARKRAVKLRTGKKATIITTNLPFTRWEEVLKDKVLCPALVDRLCHKSYLVNMTGTSYRIKETKKLLITTNGKLSFCIFGALTYCGILLGYYLVYFYVIIYSRSKRGSGL